MSSEKPKATARVLETQPLSPQEEEVSYRLHRARTVSLSHLRPLCCPLTSAPLLCPALLSVPQILAAMRSQFAGRLEHVSENTLIRYIRGYKDDPHPKEKALEMLGRMLTWRETEHVDELVKTTLPKGDVFKRIWPSGVYGHGKQGHPILVTRVGQVDGSKLTKEFSMDEVTKFHIQEMESLDRHKDEASKLHGRRIYKHVAILDLKGLGMSHLGSKFTDPLKKFIHIDQDYYPETLHVMIIVNGGLLVKTAWKLASGFLDPLTKERIKFGNQHLQEYIDHDQLSTIYGGALQTPGLEGKGETHGE